LELEDFGLQSMEDCSPTKWHLAHTTWFFETFVVARAVDDFRPFHERYAYLFNSYYESVGRMHPRPRRGLLSRPTVAEIRAYRRHVDAIVVELLRRGRLDDEALHVVELGLHHEQQHQELILTDIKHAFGSNPLRPAYRHGAVRPGAPAPAATWIDHPGGVARVGHRDRGFAFDNEGPPHRV